MKDLNKFLVNGKSNKKIRKFYDIPFLRFNGSLKAEFEKAIEI